MAYEPWKTFRPSGPLGSSITPWPLPEKLETDEQKRAAKFLMALLGRDIDFPTLQVPGMTGHEKTAQGILGDVLAGKAFQDPRTSPLYQGFRKEMARETEEGAGAMRRFAQLGGMGRSGPAMKSEGKYRARMSEKTGTMLGGLYETERERDNLYTRLLAAAQYGGLPREIEGEQAKADYTKQIQDLMAPYQLQQPIAEQLLQYMPWFQQQFTQGPSLWQSILEVLGLGAQAMPVIAPGRYGKGGGGGGGKSGGSWGASLQDPFGILGFQVAG